MDAALRARLAEIAGDKAVDGAGDTVSPGTAEEVERICAAVAEAGGRLAVSSAKSASSAPGGAVRVSLARLDALEVEPERLVLRAGAGTTLAAARAAAEGAGMALAGIGADVSGDTPLGELVARGQLSRRALTGIEAVLPGGGRVGAGGEVLKDVAGYDLAGALLGSGGRLALVTAVSLRLQPRGAAALDGAPAGVPSGVLGDALERAFDPQRLLVGRG
jgi:glycolate oxidase FAD binding subunit